MFQFQVIYFIRWATSWPLSQKNKMLVFIHSLNAVLTLSGTHTLFWNGAFLSSIDVIVKWANQMIETYVKLSTFVRKHY